MEKRICVVTTISATMKSFLVDQMKYFSKNGYRVTLICDHDENFAKALPSELKYIPVSMKRGVDGLGAWLSIYRLYKIFKTGNYDMVQYSTPNAAFYASIAAFLARVPVRLYCQWGLRYIAFSGIKHSIFKHIEKLVCRLSTFIEPDSFSNLKFCHTEGFYSHEKSRVVWNGSANGVNLKKFDMNRKLEWRKEIRDKLFIEDDVFVVGFVGSIRKDKGINELLKAFRLMLQSNSQALLLLVGDTDFLDSLETELIEWSRQCKNVIYCGQTNQVEKYMAAMDVFVLPSYREGFGTVVIEAEAMGVPVIVSDIPGPVNAILKDKTGLVVPKGEVEPLYQSIEKLAKDEICREKMGEEAAIFASGHFNQEELWKHILADRTELIRQIRKGKLGESIHERKEA